MIKHLLHQIYDHPGVSGAVGGGISFLFGMIDVQSATADVDFVTAIIKLIGVSAGAIVAVASAFNYAEKKNWFKSNKKQN